MNVTLHSINMQHATEQAELDILEAKADYWRDRETPPSPGYHIGAGIAWAGFWIGLGLVLL